jgi:hypothetical protein
VLDLVIFCQISRFSYDREFGTLVRRKPVEPVDGAPLVAGTQPSFVFVYIFSLIIVSPLVGMLAGIATLLKQLHPSVTNDWLAAVAQFLRASVYSAAASAKPTPVPQDAVSLVILLQQVCRVMRLPERILHSHVPAYLLDTLQA